MRDKDNKIRSVDKYHKEKRSVEEIKEKITEWKEEPKPELIEDQKMIEVLDSLYRHENEPDIKKELEARKKELLDLQIAITTIKDEIDGLNY
jgi:hypothetical protein